MQSDFITEEEYLAGEELIAESCEYVDGKVFAMAVPTDTHGIIQQSIGTPLHLHLRGRRCSAWMGNMRVRLAFLNRTIHYIPDVLVACDQSPRDPRFREEPLAIWEVLSKSSEATDQREKLLAYSILPTLQHYFIVRQDRLEIADVRRAGERWEEFTFTHADQEVEVPEIDFRLALSEIYVNAGL